MELFLTLSVTIKYDLLGQPAGDFFWYINADGHFAQFQKMQLRIQRKPTNKKGITQNDESDGSEAIHVI